MSVLTQINKSYQSVPDLYVKGLMKISGFNVDVRFEAYVKQHDSLKLILTGPFGIAVGALTASPDHFVFMNTYEGWVVEGKPDRTTMQKSLGLAMNYDELMALIRAEVPRMPTSAEIESGTVTTTQDGGDISYSIAHGLEVERFTIDPDKMVVTEYVRTSGSGEHLRRPIQVNYDRFIHSVGDRKFPESASFKLNDAEFSVRVTMERVKDAIPSGMSMTLTVPDGMERRDL